MVKERMVGRVQPVYTQAVTIQCKRTDSNRWVWRGRDFLLVPGILTAAVELDRG